MDEKNYLKSFEKFLSSTKFGHSVDIEYHAPGSIIGETEQFYSVSEYYNFEMYLVGSTWLEDAIYKATEERKNKGW
jgi:hypothetical protein